jgi:hypothetical protein
MRFRFRRTAFRKTRVWIPYVLLALILAITVCNAISRIVAIATHNNAQAKTASDVARYNELVFWSEIVIVTLLPSLLTIYIKAKCRSIENADLPLCYLATPWMSWPLRGTMGLMTVWSILQISLAAWAFKHQSQFWSGETDEDDSYALLVWIDAAFRIVFTFVLGVFRLPGQLVEDTLDLLRFFVRLQLFYDNDRLEQALERIEEGALIELRFWREVGTGTWYVVARYGTRN